MRNIGIIVLLCIAFSAKSQVNVRDSATTSWMFQVRLNGIVSGGDLADRFGNSLGVGMDIDRKLPNNWLFGIGGTYFFGQTVMNEKTIFNALITDQNLFIGLNGDLAGVEFFQRGFYTGAHVGKLFPVIGPNQSSGILIRVGAGYLQNFIHKRHPNSYVPQIDGEYWKGYDRKHDGFALRQQVSFMHSGNKRTVNFIIGLEFIEGFTKSVRGYNYDQKAYDLESKLDLYLGAHFTWFLPLYSQNKQKFYYY